MEYMSGQLQVMDDPGEFHYADAIVRLKIICTKEQKAMIEEDVIAKLLLDTVNVHKINAIGYEITDGTAVRNSEINESLSPAGALNKWIGMQDYKEEMENRIKMEGEKIIKG
jgi:hypothetical protein